VSVKAAARKMGTAPLETRATTKPIPPSTGSSSGVSLRTSRYQAVRISLVGRFLCLTNDQYIYRTLLRLQSQSELCLERCE
jgi:hypothetical protein